MKTSKFIIIGALLAIVLTSCGKLVKKEVLDASEQENKELRDSLKEMQDNFVAQNEELNSILEELSSINCQTLSLQLNVENGVADQTQAEKISDNIQTIKERIDRLEKEAQRARKLNKDLAIATSTIKTLRQTIANQEQEIDRLKKVVSEQSDTIETQKDTILNQQENLKKQNALILSQKNQLDEIVKRQTRLLFEAGAEFESLADEGSFTIKGKKDRASVAEYRKSIYEKSITFYREALRQGHPDAEAKIAGVQEKIALL